MGGKYNKSKAYRMDLKELMEEPPRWREQGTTSNQEMELRKKEPVS
jgi:hypothetical protein